MSDISGFKLYETKPAKTFGGLNNDETIDICPHCNLNNEICWCNETEEKDDE